jgi:hypothetical protein
LKKLSRKDLIKVNLPLHKTLNQTYNFFINLGWVAKDAYNSQSEMISQILETCLNQPCLLTDWTFFKEKKEMVHRTITWGDTTTARAR